MEILMENLIKELQAPRHFPPTAAALRASTVIKELLSRANADTQARILAEQKLITAEAEIARLTQELINARKNNIDNESTSTSNS